MSARLAPPHTRPYCTALPMDDGAGHVQVYDLHTRELVAVHEAQPHLQVTAPALQGVRLLLARVHDDLHALAQDLRPPKAEQGESEGGAA